jgi:hypothetical protein
MAALTDELKSIAHRLIHVQFRDRDILRGQEIRQIRADFSIRGALGHSAMGIQIVQACTNDLRDRILVATDVLQQVVLRVGKYERGLAEEMKNFLGDYVEIERTAVIQTLDAQPNAYGRQYNTRPLDEAVTLAREDMQARVDLFAASLSRAEEPRPGNVSISVGGNVGAIQTGSNATAHITQTGLAEDQVRRLRAALAQIRDYYQGQPSSKDSSDVLELVTEADLEVQKTGPNLRRVGLVAQGLAVTVQTIAALKPAYDALKPLLIALGVPVPL